MCVSVGGCLCACAAEVHALVLVQSSELSISAVKTTRGQEEFTMACMPVLLCVCVCVCLSVCVCLFLCMSERERKTERAPDILVFVNKHQFICDM